MNKYLIDRNFVGREEVLSILHKRVSAFANGYRQNVALIGRAHMGKTTVIQKFISEFDDPTIVPVYVEVVSEPFDYFVKKFMGAFLHSYLVFRVREVPDSFDELVKKAKKYVPHTLKAMHSVSRQVKRRDYDKAFSMLLELSTILQKETGKKVLIFLEQFDRLQQFDITEPFSHFSNQIMMQKDSMYVVTSSRPAEAEVIFREKLSLLFGNFESLKINAFNFKESSEFIRSRIAPIDIEQAYINILIRLTDGHPYYLELLSDDIKKRALYKEISVTKDILIDTFTDLIFNKTGSIYQHFMIKLTPFNRSNAFNFYLNILLAITCGRKKLTDISKFVEKDRKEVKRALQRLIEERVIDKTGNFYHLRNVLMRFWLKYVFHPEFVFLGISSGHTELKFRSSFNELIEVAMQEEQKELSEKVEELLRSFSNDVIELDSKRMKCPTFSEVYKKPTNGNINPILAQGQKTRWLCQVANSPVSEDDIQTLVVDSKKMRKKVNKKILIIPHGISLNAKLLAKQQKITIWNLRNLNFVFDLYDKPKVIV